jgi:hypothetical protein
VIGSVVGVCVALALQALNIAIIKNIANLFIMTFSLLEPLREDTDDSSSREKPPNAFRSGQQSGVDNILDVEKNSKLVFRPFNPSTGSGRAGSHCPRSGAEWEQPKCLTRICLK